MKQILSIQTLDTTNEDIMFYEKVGAQFIKLDRAKLLNMKLINIIGLIHQGKLYYQAF